MAKSEAIDVYRALWLCMMFQFNKLWSRMVFSPWLELSVVIFPSEKIRCNLIYSSLSHKRINPEADGLNRTVW